MANKPYENRVLEVKLDDFYLTKMAADNYMQIDNSLTAKAGDIYEVRTYTATGTVEDLAMGEGNTTSVETGYIIERYKVKKTQGKFVYFDEEEDKDPMIIDTGIAKLGAEIVNNKTTNFFAALARTPFTYSATQFDFDAFVDAIATLNLEEDEALYGFVSPADKADIKKLLKDDLKYVEAYVRTGYIGHVAGVPLVVSKAVPKGTIYLATNKAVTCYNKRGTEVEQKRDPDTRKNEIFGRVTRVIALTDATKAVKLTKSEAEQTPYVQLDKDTATVKEDEQIRLVAATYPAGTPVEWTSNDEDTAIVDENGTVLGVAAGTATITAKITVDKTDYTDTCAVTVVAGE